MNGLKLAAIYGYPPFRLGFCGPEGQENLDTLTEFIKDNESLADQVRKILSRFKAAYPYYRLIAKHNQIPDPFDEKVVKAYWLGNRLLAKVPHSALKTMILNDFCQPELPNYPDLKRTASTLTQDVRPHHSFHVLFVGSVSGQLKFTTRVRDTCRIGWGRVIKIKNEKLKMKNCSLKLKNGKYYLAKESLKEIGWEKSFVPQVKVGDMVSLHWGRACQVLNKNDVEDLEKYTRMNIEAVNRR